MDAWIASLLHTLSLPEVGLPTVFIVAFVSATLLPMGSEPALFGLVKLNPELFWPGVLVATAGNTLGGAVSWAMGYGVHAAIDRVRGSPTHLRALQWLERFGPKACLLSWLPVIGDPLCAVAGWLKFPLLPCLLYMAIGKGLRYVIMTAGLLWLIPGDWSAPADEARATLSHRRSWPVDAPCEVATGAQLSSAPIVVRCPKPELSYHRTGRK